MEFVGVAQNFVLAQAQNINFVQVARTLWEQPNSISWIVGITAAVTIITPLVTMPSASPGWISPRVAFDRVRNMLPLLPSPSPNTSSESPMRPFDMATSALPDFPVPISDSSPESSALDLGASQESIVAGQSAHPESSIDGSNTTVSSFPTKASVPPPKVSSIQFDHGSNRIVAALQPSNALYYTCIGFLCFILGITMATFRYAAIEAWRIKPKKHNAPADALSELNQTRTERDGYALIIYNNKIEAETLQKHLRRAEATIAGYKERKSKPEFDIETLERENIGLNGQVQVHSDRATEMYDDHMETKSSFDRYMDLKGQEIGILRDRIAKAEASKERHAAEWEQQKSNILAQHETALQAKDARFKAYETLSSSYLKEACKERDDARDGVRRREQELVDCNIEHEKIIASLRADRDQSVEQLEQLKADSTGKDLQISRLNAELSELHDVKDGIEYCRLRTEDKVKGLTLDNKELTSKRDQPTFTNVQLSAKLEDPNTKKREDLFENNRIIDERLGEEDHQSAEKDVTLRGETNKLNEHITLLNEAQSESTGTFDKISSFQDRNSIDLAEQQRELDKIVGKIDKLERNLAIPALDETSDEKSGEHLIVKENAEKQLFNSLDQKQKYQKQFMDLSNGYDTLEQQKLEPDQQISMLDTNSNQAYESLKTQGSKLPKASQGMLDRDEHITALGKVSADLRTRLPQSQQESTGLQDRLAVLEKDQQKLAQVRNHRKEEKEEQEKSTSRFKDLIYSSEKLSNLEKKAAGVGAQLEDAENDTTDRLLAVNDNPNQTDTLENETTKVMAQLKATDAVKKDVISGLKVDLTVKDGGIDDFQSRNAKFVGSVNKTHEEVQCQPIDLSAKDQDIQRLWGQGARKEEEAKDVEAPKVQHHQELKHCEATSHEQSSKPQAAPNKIVQAEKELSGPVQAHGKPPVDHNDESKRHSFVVDGSRKFQEVPIPRGSSLQLVEKKAIPDLKMVNDVEYDPFIHVVCTLCRQQYLQGSNFTAHKGFCKGKILCAYCNRWFILGPGEKFEVVHAGACRMANHHVQLRPDKVAEANATRAVLKLAPLNAKQHAKYNQSDTAPTTLTTLTTSQNFLGQFPPHQTPPSPTPMQSPGQMLQSPGNGWQYGHGGPSHSPFTRQGPQAPHGGPGFTSHPGPFNGGTFNRGPVSGLAVNRQSSSAPVTPPHMQNGRSNMSLPNAQIPHAFTPAMDLNSSRNH